MRFTLTLTFIILCTANSLAISQTGNGSIKEWEDVILLKTGVSFKGIIFEQIPNKYYKIRLYDGKILEFNAELVDVVTRQPRVKQDDLQQEEAQNKNVQPTKIYSTYDTQTKPLWLTVGPYLNLGFSSGKVEKDTKMQAFYGLGIGASVGTKISDNTYIMGMIAADFNNVDNFLSKDIPIGHVEENYASKLNVYRIGMGISHKFEDFFAFIHIGELFAESWDSEYIDYKRDKVPEQYASDSYPFFSGGVLIPLTDGIVVSNSADITDVFGSFIFSAKVGLVYTPNF